MSAPIEVIDHEARNMASVALIKIEEHEKTCGERWTETRDKMSALFRGHRQILMVLLAGQGAVILFLAALIVTLSVGGYAR